MVKDGVGMADAATESCPRSFCIEDDGCWWVTGEGCGGGCVEG